MTKKNSKPHQYFFVDESGDPTFYDRQGNNIVGTGGCSKILLLGLIRTHDPDNLRKELLKLHKEVINDPYFDSVPSIEKTKIAFHAKDDVPEIREKVFKVLKELDFKAEFVVARKNESVFEKRHHKKEGLFYNDLVSKLFENKLHVAEKNTIYFAVRGNKDKQGPFSDAIQAAMIAFENKWKIKNDSEIIIIPQSPSGEPCLQVIDYMNWAIQRAFNRGEDRYYKFLEEKVSFLVDIYDFDKYSNNFYNRKNKFEVNKISPL